jgi:prepilin-type N-terminal cleavage/methylation domain-containing protein
MADKKSKGFTLVELIITIAVLSIVTVIMGSVFMRTMSNKKLAEKMLNDQYNARRALLTMSRDLHHVSEDDVPLVKSSAELGAGSDTPYLSFTRSNDGKEFNYYIVDVDGVNMLARTEAADAVIPFVPVELSGLKTEWVNIDGTPVGLPVSDADKRFLKITVTTSPDNPDTAEDDSVEFETTISVSRIPPKATT